jgi:hypothetical protein
MGKPITATCTKCKATGTRNIKIMVSIDFFTVYKCLKCNEIFVRKR